jgi:hypothetical protein
LFPRLQAVDVNVATRWKLRAARRHGDVIVLERSPWDTLADVILDTGDSRLADNRWGRWITAHVRGRGPVFWVDRPREAILVTRNELVHDRRLGDKIAIYAMLAARHSWQRLANDGPIEETKEALAICLAALSEWHAAPGPAGGRRT